MSMYATTSGYTPRYIGYESQLMSRETAVVHRQTVKPEARKTTISHRGDSASYSSAKPFSRRPMLALLISAHNEETVLEKTLRSAMRAGMQRQHIYVVDDNSTDDTLEIARRILGASNVVRVDRSGKGTALSKAAKHFQLTRRYRWIHIADADGGFAPDYFTVFRRELRVKYAAATGYIRSLPGGPVSQYRVFEYTLGLQIHRRFQAMIGTISVIPGPSSCFRSDVFAKVNFANESITEDFDVTMQLHRKKLGPIQYITGAVAYTQDPKTVRDFVKQITRWYRGLMQGVRTHGIGRQLKRIDAYLSYQILQNVWFFATYFVVVPAIALLQGSAAVLAAAFLYDVAVTWLLTVGVAAFARRWDILAAFPHIYALRWLSVSIFLKALFEVVVLGKFKNTTGAWTTVERYDQPVVTS